MYNLSVLAMAKQIVIHLSSMSIFLFALLFFVFSIGVNIHRLHETIKPSVVLSTRLQASIALKPPALMFLINFEGCH